MAAVPIVVEPAARPLGDVAERLARFMRPGALTLAALPPLSLYVHLPWCLKKCPYCDFNSHAWRGDAGALPEARYVDALIRDLEASLPFVWGRRVHTVFIGGGTPSLFAPASIERLVAAIRARLPLEPGCEITLEANPGTFERERFHAYAEAGVTRLSIGVQSFDDAKLPALGRVHDAAQARAAVEEAKAAFATFNLDLMYALPGQTLAECGADVEAALSFAPPHLSLYHLTIEPNTFFAVHPAGGARRRPRRGHARPGRRERRQAPASSATRSRPSRAPATAPATTSTTGSSATTSASAPAPTARSASRTASRARCACAIRRPTWPAPRPARRSPPRARSRAPTCRSSSCSTRCA